MFIVMPIVAAVVLVFLGYIALWSASQPNTPAGISSFGRVMAILLFVIAGLGLFAGATMGCRMGGMMKGGMPCQMGMMQHMQGRGPGAMMPGPEGRGMMPEGKGMQNPEGRPDGAEKPAQK